MRLINRTLLWRVALFLSFAAGIYLLLLTLQSIDYVWRWNRVPQYFYYTGDEPEYSPINGEVGEVMEKGKKSHLVLLGDREEMTVVVDTALLEVRKGDFISAGDLLGSVRVEKIGLLTLGLFNHVQAVRLLSTIRHYYRSVHTVCPASHQTLS